MNMQEIIIGGNQTQEDWKEVSTKREILLPTVEEFRLQYRKHVVEIQEVERKTSLLSEFMNTVQTEIGVVRETIINAAIHMMQLHNMISVSIPIIIQRRILAGNQNCHFPEEMVLHINTTKEGIPEHTKYHVIMTNTKGQKLKWVNIPETLTVVDVRVHSSTIMILNTPEMDRNLVLLQRLETCLESFQKVNELRAISQTIPSEEQENYRQTWKTQLFQWKQDILAALQKTSLTVAWASQYTSQGPTWVIKSLEALFDVDAMEDPFWTEYQEKNVVLYKVIPNPEGDDVLFFSTIRMVGDTIFHHNENKIVTNIRYQKERDLAEIMYVHSGADTEQVCS